MATVSIVKLKVRRGTDSERKQITLDNGEIGFVTTPASNRLFVGDGVTQGGIPVSTKFHYAGTDVDTGAGLETAQKGDLVYDSTMRQMFVLTGIDTNGFPAYDERTAYQFISSPVDKQTITYTPNGVLQVPTQGISAVNINNNLFNSLGGFVRSSPNGTVSVNYDNVKIVLNVNSALTVNEPQLNIESMTVKGKTLDITADGLALSVPVDTLGFGNGLRTGQIYRDVNGFLKVKL